MNWKKVKLSDIVTISKGKKHTEISDRTAKRYIQIEDLSQNYTPKYTSEKGVEVVPNDVIIAWDGANAGKVGTNLNGVIGSTLARLKPLSNNINGNFLYRYLQAEEREIKSKRTGATIPHVNGAELRNMQIPLPPLATQQRIAAILDKADELRKKDKLLFAKYDALLQSVFYDMFGDSMIKEKGKNFDTYFLTDIADIVSGVAKNGNTIQADFIEVPYMRVANVQDSHIVLDEIKTMKVSQRDFDKFKLKKDDILLTEGGDPDKLGRGAVWHNEIEPCIHQNHIFRVRANFEIVNPTYLSFHIGSGYGKSYFLKAAKQTTGIASINLTQLKKFSAIIPPLKLQNKFASVAKNIQQQKQQIKKQMEQSEKLFQGLLQKAFNGELIKE